MDRKSGDGGNVNPQYQWVSEKDSGILTVHLTGLKDFAEFKKEDLKVKIDKDRNLTVSGERRQRFEKKFTMGNDYDITEIKANFVNGVLTVAVPKLVKYQPSATTPTPEAAQTTSPATPAAPAPISPVMPDPKAALDEGKPRAAAPSEKGKRDAASDKEAEPAAEKLAPPHERRPSPPPPPTAEGKGPRSQTGTRQWLTWVVAVSSVVMAAMVMVLVGGLGFFYSHNWRHGIGASPDEQQMECFGAHLTEFLQGWGWCSCCRSPPHC